MKTQLLIALTCSSLALADRGNDFSNGNSSVLKGNDFSNRASDSGGYSFQSLLEWLSEYGQSSHTEDNRLKADKNRDAKVDFRDFLMILSGCSTPKKYVPRQPWPGFPGRGPFHS